MRKRTRSWCAGAAIGATAAAWGFACSSSFKAGEEPSAMGGAGGNDAGDGGEDTGTGGAERGGTSGSSTGGASGSSTGGTSGDSTGGVSGSSGEGGAPEPTGGTGTGGVIGGAGGASGVGGASGGLGGASGAGGSTGSRTYRDVVLADEPLVYWRMGIEGGLFVPDETGGGNELVLQGSGHELGVEGAISNDSNTAIGFDGVSSFAVATDPRVFDFTERAPFTLECWARRINGSNGYFQHLFSNIVGSAGDRDGYVLYLLPEPEGTDAQRTAFEYNRPGVEVGLWGAMPEEATWAHYVVVVDGSTVTLFVNGTNEDSRPINGAFAARTGPFAVGRAANENGHHFKGALDEMAVYPRPLSLGEIVAHYALGRR